MNGASGRKPVIGLMGGIGSGKSHVARAFESLGCGVIDADRLAREALNSAESITLLRQWWGDSIIGADGLPDRKAIAARVFQRPDELSRLEALLHPMVNQRREALRSRYNADPSVVAIIEDSPLLLEKYADYPVNARVFVKASYETRLARVQRSRGWDRGELDRREKLQVGLDIKESRADYVVENNDGSDCVLQAQRILQQVLRSPQASA